MSGIKRAKINFKRLKSWVHTPISRKWNLTSKKEKRIFTNMWKLNNILIIKWAIRKYTEMNENKQYDKTNGKQLKQCLEIHL